MANTMLAPSAEKPINYKTTAVFYIGACVAAFIIDIRQQQRDQREAAAAQALADDQTLAGIIRVSANTCVSAHCAEGRHVYREDIEDQADDVDDGQG